MQCHKKNKIKVITFFLLLNSLVINMAQQLILPSLILGRDKSPSVSGKYH